MMQLTLKGLRSNKNETQEQTKEIAKNKLKQMFKEVCKLQN